MNVVISGVRSRFLRVVKGLKERTILLLFVKPMKGYPRQAILQL